MRAPEGLTAPSDEMCARGGRNGTRWTRHRLAGVTIDQMRFSWRTDDTPLPGHAAWLDHLDPKNRKPGTSAPTLAAAWSGPLDLLGALATHARLRHVALRSATVEARTSFDAYGGNVRNHDLVVRAVTADGEPVVVCVEAKAGEPLGATVAEQAAPQRKRSTPTPTRTHPRDSRIL